MSVTYLILVMLSLRTWRGVPQARSLLTIERSAK